MSSLTLDWLHTIVLLGALQGVFLSAVLATKQRNRIANRLLAAAMLAFSMSLASAVYHSAGLVPAFPHFFGAAYPMPFLYGPLVYLYACTAANRDRHLNPADALHFVPFIATILVGLPIYMMSGLEKVALFTELQAGQAPLLIRIVDPLKFVSGITYAAITMVFLQRHRERVKDSYSSTEHVNLRWLLWLGGSGAAIWLLALTLMVLNKSHVLHIARVDDFVSLAIAVLVYLIGYMGLRQPEVFRYETAEFPVQMPAAAEPDEGPRYERSGLSERQAERLRNALLALMDAERPWRDCELTLADLAERMHTTPHRLSEVLNTQLGESFHDFVNGYRVREVQRRITAPEAHNMSILALALDAGFASKSTFNVVFKKLTGQTPSDFRQTVGA